MSGVTEEDINDRAARIAQDILILERLQKRNSGVTVTTGDADIQKQNQRSLFETLCLRENKKKHRITFSTSQKLAYFASNTQSCHVEVLKEIRDIPDEKSLLEVERLFEISINVYIFERFEDALRPVLIKSKGGDKQLNVVYLSGRFLYVKDIKTFFNTYTVADDTNRENARLQWIRSHKHVLTLDKNSHRQRYRGGVSSFFRFILY